MAHAKTIEWPNREKASSKVMRAVVVLTLLLSSALMLVHTVLSWDLLQGAKPAQVLFVVLNVIFVIQLLRWSRGVLPMAAGLAVFVAIFAAVSISNWFARDAPGYDHASLASSLGYLTIAILIVQAFVIVLTIMAFLQNWQIEVERHAHETLDGPPPRRNRPAPGGSVPA